ncbi:MAG: acyl-ACP--UDP-N-acetylglucosamine O-acyltransferase [Fibrobacterota bacterium]
MSSQIDTQAVVHPDSNLGKNVRIGPFAVIEENVYIGDNTVIDSHARIGSNTTIGTDCHIFNGASVGTIAQDLKYSGEESFLEIGDRTIIREFCTINKGTQANKGLTKIGNDCALLAYCHVGHDCLIGDKFISSNGLAVAGHVTIGDQVICGGNVSIHQFSRIGDHAFIGANKYITQDVVPFALIAGDTLTASLYGINSVGLKRRGFSSEDMSTIKKAYKILFRNGHTLEEAQNLLEKTWPGDEIIASLIQFVSKSNRGLLRFKK